MALPHRPKTQDESEAALRHVSLVWVRYNARIEQRGCFEGIFVNKVSANKLTLNVCECRMCREGAFHFVRPCLDNG